MANEEHLAILRQGIAIWNKWREEHTEIVPDLSAADLGMANLKAVNLSGVNLMHADLSKADLMWSNLKMANMLEADLTLANLIETNLTQANLTKANLTGANLTDANLREANLSKVLLNDADLNNTILGATIFSDLNLSTVRNLHLARHNSPSTIGIDTLYKSQGAVPYVFLKGCGVPETIITLAKSLVGTPIEYYSCFISYSTKDEEFANQLHDRMKREGLRVWFAPEEIKGGKKIHEQIYDAIRYHDKIILILSEASINSSWVEVEIKRTKKHEQEDKRRKLFPISLVPFEKIKNWRLLNADDGRDLAREIREYYIPDFSNWKDYDSFNWEFEKLLKALRADDREISLEK